MALSDTGSGGSGSLAYQFAHSKESRQTETIVLTVVFTCVSTTATALRLFARSLVKGRWGFDDAIIVFSQIVSFAYCGLTVAASRHAFGKHIVVASLQEIYTTKEIQYFIEICYVLGVFSVKYAILMFYHRIFSTQRFRRAVWIYTGVLTCYTIGTLVSAIFPCKPISYYWNNNQDGGCINHYAYSHATGVISLVLDVLILSMPMPVVWRLRVSTKQKLALSCIFLVGIFACMVSIFRLTVLHLLYTDDPAWDSYWPSVWSTIELNVCILCACLPLMRPLARKFGDLHLSKCIPSFRSYLPSLRSSKGIFSSKSRATVSSTSTVVAPASPRKRTPGPAWYASLDDTLISTTVGADVEASATREESGKETYPGSSIPLHDLSGLAVDHNENTAYHPYTASPRNTTQITVTHLIEVKEEEGEVGPEDEEKKALVATTKARRESAIIQFRRERDVTDRGGTKSPVLHEADEASKVGNDDEIRPAPKLSPPRSPSPTFSPSRSPPPTFTPSSPLPAFSPSRSPPSAFPPPRTPPPNYPPPRTPPPGFPPPRSPPPGGSLPPGVFDRRSPPPRPLNTTSNPTSPRPHPSTLPSPLRSHHPSAQFVPWPLPGPVIRQGSTRQSQGKQKQREKGEDEEVEDDATG